MHRFLKAVLVAAGAALLALPAAAEYPERPVQLISPYPAGGAADVLARYLGKELEAQLGKSVIILNKPGAGTIIGAQAAATAPADGYTLFLSSNSTFSANPAVYAKLPYDPATDFEPIGMVATLSFVILTQANSPLQNLADLVTAAKADPKKYLFATFGNATAPHFAAEMLKEAAGIEMTHVPYRGSAPAMTDLIGGSNIMVLASHSMPLLREWCNRGIFMEQGRPVVDGSIEEAIAAYQTSSGARQMASRRR